MDLGRTDYETIVKIAFVHLLLGHYRNQLLFLFLPEAILALSLHGHMPCSTGRTDSHCCSSVKSMCIGWGKE